LRDDETVAGVGVTGAGTCGAMLHGHVGVATGRCEDDGWPGAEWRQQHDCNGMPGCVRTTAATAQTPETCNTCALARNSRNERH